MTVLTYEVTGSGGGRVQGAAGSGAAAPAPVGPSLAGHRFQEPALFDLWVQSEGALERGDHREAARVEVDTWVAGMDRPPEAVDPEVRRRVTDPIPSSRSTSSSRVRSVGIMLRGRAVI